MSTNPSATRAIKKTSSLVALPSPHAKVTRLSRHLNLAFNPSTKRTCTKGVTMVIGINKGDATPTASSALQTHSQPVEVGSPAVTEIKPKRSYKTRKSQQVVEPLPLNERKWISIKQAAAMYPKSEQAFRHLAHQSARQLKYPQAGLPSSGFEKCVVRQPGSRNVYLIVEELDRWMAMGQGGVQ